MVSAIWHSMRADADAHMKKLGALRDELQSELLVSISRKVNKSDLRNSQAFQNLEGDVKALAEAVLKGNSSIKQAINGLEIAAEEQHRQFMKHLSRFGLADATPVGSNIDMESWNMERRIDELLGRLWFDSITRRQSSIKAAYKNTFEWIFTDQRKTSESNTTLVEWMSAGNGLYWMSGRAGTGKSSLIRFLQHDPRTLSAFHKWAGARPLILATFYFWNSEAAGDDRLKLLEGLYRGIFFDLINQNMEFAGLLFPNHLVVGRKWSDGFPTMPDLAEAFERLSTADELPAAVGLLIDGLDEYEATSSEQMALAEMLCRAGERPYMKIIVSSRPEAAFETIFRDSTKLRLHELTENDRRIYSSDKLRAVPRFGTIATDKEQSRLIDLIIKRSEGIFLWVDLTVKTLIQEIEVSMKISELENVVNGIPSGSEELARLFDHMLRNRIPTKTQLLGYSLIRALQDGYKFRRKIIPWARGEEDPHPISSVLVSFFEHDLVSALKMPVRPLTKAEITSRVELAANLVRRSCAGLLEPKPVETHLGRPEELGPEIHFLHKDVAIYLSQQDTHQFLEKALDPIKARLQTKLLKCVVIMMKLYNTKERPGKIWDIWYFAELAMRIARHSEEDDLPDTEKLLDEIDRTMMKHCINFPPASLCWHEIKTGSKKGCHWTEAFPIDPRYDGRFSWPRTGQGLNLLTFSIEQGLFRYAESKLRKTGKILLEKPGLPLLSSACGSEPIWWHLDCPVRPEIVKLLLEYGADPNETFEGISCWQTLLVTAAKSGGSTAHELRYLADTIKLLLYAGADPYASIKFKIWEQKFYSTAERQIRITFIDGEAEVPELYKRRVYKMNPRDREQIKELGRDLLVLLQNKKKGWRVPVFQQ